jgi:hypothetical protein
VPEDRARVHLPHDLDREELAEKGGAVAVLLHDAGEVFAAFLEVRHGVFVDVFFERQRQQGAEPLTLCALGDRRFTEARVVAALEVDHWDLERARQAIEHRLARLGLADHAPIDGHRQYPLVVGDDPTDPRFQPRKRASLEGTWYPTEYSKLRVQYAYDDRTGFSNASSVWLQFEFLLGAHAAHKF